MELLLIFIFVTLMVIVGLLCSLRSTLQQHFEKMRDELNGVKTQLYADRRKEGE